MNVAPIRDAGTYRVTINVSKEGYDTPAPIVVKVTIAKAPVAAPRPLSTLEEYTGAEQQGLAEPDADALYFYQRDSQLTGKDADDYTAWAQLNDKDNYCWSSGDENGDGVVEIKWSIARRPVVETEINSMYSAPVPYDGKLKTAVGEPSSATGFFTFTYEEGTLVGKTKDTKVLAFTITNAQQTNADTYPVTATIEDRDNFYWKNHPDDPVLDLGSWTISQLQIVRPTVSAKTVTYDGAAYEAGNITLTHSTGTGSILGSEGLVTLGTDHTYYASSTAGTPMDGAPIGAGRYYVEPDLEYDSTNYALVGGEERVSLLIEKAKLTLTAPTEEGKLKVDYTGSDYTVPRAGGGWLEGERQRRQR